MVRIRLALVAVLCTVVALAAAASVSARQYAIDAHVHSKALAGTVHALVVLPPDYARSHGRRYPVIYFLHGLPAGPDTYAQSRWLGAELRSLHRDAILVEPQGARAGDTDPEYLDWGQGRNWETYVAREVPAWVDAHFRTIRSRQGRAIIGLSAGGYGASLVGFDYPDEFSVVESWSGYFRPTDPTGTTILDRGSPAANAAANVRELIRDAAAAHRLPTFFGFYVGHGDTRFLAANVQLNQQLTKAHIPHVYAVYPGGHTTALWEAHAPEWLRMALNHLASPT